MHAFVAAMRAHNIACAPVQDRGYGLVTRLTLPGGGKLGVYQPRHARPKPTRPRAKATSAASRAGATAKKRTAAKPPMKRPPVR